MKLYFAPLEGITNFIFRNAFEECFPKAADRYYCPFITTANAVGMNKKELRDILPENNPLSSPIPQLLTRKSGEFSDVINYCIAPLGYSEVNLNLGCPSGTVTAKGKGSGFLAFPDELDRFFDDVFSKTEKTDMKISVKTRIGSESPDEFYKIMEIYNRYPICELTIHPRLRTDKYKNHPNLEMYRLAYETAKMPLCYNGDIFSLNDYEKLMEKFPETPSIMLGRGVIANPRLFSLIKGENPPQREDIRKFHDLLLDGYRSRMSGDISIMHKMRELWFYMMHLFSDSQKNIKRIRKCKTIVEYISIVDDIFANYEMHDTGFVAP